MIKLNEFCGNKNIVSSIENAISSRHLLGAYIIAGQEGCGKLTLAGIMAKAFVCSNKDNPPCYSCAGCKKADSLAHPDIIYVKCGSGKKQITVSQIRELAANAYILPNESEHKVFIIQDEMNIPAQNALLKIFESPPDFASIIILSSNLNLLLPTVRSRALIYKLSVPPYKEAFDFIKEFYNYSNEQINDALSKANCNIGRTLNIINSNAADNNGDSAAEDYFKAALTSEADALLFLKETIKNVDSLNAFILNLKNILLNILLCYYNGNDNNMKDLDNLSKVSNLSKYKLSLVIELLDKFVYNKDINLNFNLYINYFNAKIQEVLH